MPGHEFGLDVIAWVGAMRYREHATVREIHQEPQRRGVRISERSVSNQLQRYEELLAVRLRDNSRLQGVLSKEGRVILAIDGLQPVVGHEVLWVLRDCLSGEVLLAQALLSARAEEIAGMITRVQEGLPVPIARVISDGQRSIRKAVAQALPDVPHGLCHFHYLREAARPIYEAGRRAKKELKKRVRGVRGIERAVEGREDAAGDVIRGYCAAVRGGTHGRWKSPIGCGRVAVTAACIPDCGKPGEGK